MTLESEQDKYDTKCIEALTANDEMYNYYRGVLTGLAIGHGLINFLEERIPEFVIPLSI